MLFSPTVTFNPHQPPFNSRQRTLYHVQNSKAYLSVKTYNHGSKQKAASPGLSASSELVRSQALLLISSWTLTSRSKASVFWLSAKTLHPKLLLQASASFYQPF